MTWKLYKQDRQNEEQGMNNKQGNSMTRIPSDARPQGLSPFLKYLEQQ